MKDFLSLAVLFWIPPLISILKYVLWDLYFWQVKEYRFDRFWVHIRWDQEPANRNLNKIIIKFILFSLISIVLASPLGASAGIAIAYAIWFNDGIKFIEEIINNKLKRPSISFRNLLILFLIIICLITLICLVTIPFAILDRKTDSGIFLDYFSNSSVENINNALYPDVLIYLALSSLTALLIEMSSPFIVSFFVLLTYPIAKIRRQLIIRKARKKISALKKKPYIIAITGSQGKTTTKEILFEILKDKFNVGKTLENQNTDVGLALSILSQLKSNTNIFIAEMGAIRSSEIKNMCRILKPDSSIVTDIGTQHIAIFGSQEKLFKAKGEIIESLQENGNAILNGDNEFCLKMIRKDCNNYVYYTNENISAKLNESYIIPVKIHAVKELTNKITFKLNYNKKDYDFEFNATGLHLVNNITASIIASLCAGLTIDEVQSSLKKVEIKLPRLSLSKGDNETIVIEDTYSSNEKGFEAAVKFMNSQKISGKRIVVTRGIIELGRHKEHIYKNLVSAIRNDIDILITSDATLHKLMLKDNTKVQSLLVHSNDDFKYTIRTVVEPKDLILLEGRLHPSIISEIISEDN